MRVVDVLPCIAGRGIIAVVEDVPVDLHQDDALVRKSDGFKWYIQGLEYAGYRKGGDKIGFVLGTQQPAPKVNDELTYEPQAVTLPRLKKLCEEQQKRIERLELALALACPPDAMVTRMTELIAMLDEGKHVWMQPFRDKEGHFFLRVEASRKGKDDGRA
jgi:hypothetical protein